MSLVINFIIIISSANYDYKPVNVTLMLESSQLEWHIEVDIVNDVLAEGLETFMVQIAANSSSVEFEFPEFEVHISPNDRKCVCVCGIFKIVN